MNKDIAKCIMTLEEAVAWRQELRNQNKKLVVTNGCLIYFTAGMSNT